MRSWWGGGEEGERRQGSRSDPGEPPLSATGRRSCALLSGAVLKRHANTQDFINMTWSNCVKCKDALLRAWGAASFTGERMGGGGGGGRGSHKVIWHFISSWAWLAAC